MGSSLHVVSGATGWYPLAQTIENALVTRIDFVSEECVFELEKGGSREEGVTTSLMRRPDSNHLELVCYFIEATSQVLTSGVLHGEVLDVVDIREENIEELVEVTFLLRHGLKGEELEEVSEVISGVERDPDDVITQDNTGGGQLLAEIFHIYPALLVDFELDAGITEEIDRLLGVHVLREAQLEVKLPRATIRWVLAVAVGEGETDLDHFKEIHITPHGLVVVVRNIPEGTHGSGHNSRELCIHGDIRVFFDESPDDVELFVEVVGPHVTNVAIRSSSSFWRHP